MKMTNSEYFKTPRERASGFRNWCLNIGCESCPFSKHLFDCGDYARFKWLDMEYVKTPTRTLRDDVRTYFEATKRKRK